MEKLTTRKLNANFQRKEAQVANQSITRTKLKTNKEENLHCVVNVDLLLLFALKQSPHEVSIDDVIFLFINLDLFNDKADKEAVDHYLSLGHDVSCIETLQGCHVKLRIKKSEKPSSEHVECALFNVKKTCGR